MVRFIVDHLAVGTDGLIPTLSSVVSTLSEGELPRRQFATREVEQAGVKAELG
jgi:hypothetical protein